MIKTVKNEVHAASEGNPTGAIRTFAGFLIPYLCLDDVQRLIGVSWSANKPHLFCN